MAPGIYGIYYTRVVRDLKIFGYGTGPYFLFFRVRVRYNRYTTKYLKLCLETTTLLSWPTPTPGFITSSTQWEISHRNFGGSSARQNPINTQKIIIILYFMVIIWSQISLLKNENLSTGRRALIQSVSPALNLYFFRRSSLI